MSKSVTDTYELVQDTDLSFFKLQGKHNKVFNRISFRDPTTGKFTKSMSSLTDLADVQMLDNLIKLAENLLEDYKMVRSVVNA